MPSTPNSQSPEPKHRKTYTKEFKTQAVALARRPGMAFRQAASDLGINEAMLREWASVSSWTVLMLSVGMESGLNWRHGLPPWSRRTGSSGRSVILKKTKISSLRSAGEVRLF